MSDVTKRETATLQDAYSQPPFPDQHMTAPGLEAVMNPRPEYQATHYRPAGKLDGKVAMVTGGDSGIGRAVAFLFAREGADVALVYLSVEQSDAEETASAIEREGHNVLLLAGDVREYTFCQQAIEQTVARFGHLDILVNNAAYQKHREAIEDISSEQWERTFRTNIFAYFYMVKAALPYLKPGASIINTGSITGLEGSPQLVDYSATKGAIHAFTKSLAQNLVQRKVRVNCVAPGPVWTPLNPAERTAEDMKDFGADTPFGRPAQPEEIAPAYVFFASEADSSYITGHILPILGGDTIAA
jgi:NAD(P)-dependent dehydrogenase (short-subunit alcohol dehydrogenase family)